MSENETNQSASKASITVGEGTGWQRERVQSESPDFLSAKSQVDEGAELTRVISRVDQSADGAQPWTLTPKEAIEKMGPTEFNSAYGVAGHAGENAAPLDPPMILTGRMPEDGQFITTEALREYNSSDKLSAIEVVAKPDTVITTGAYELSKAPTYSELFPPELKDLQVSGSLPQQSQAADGPTQFSTDTSVQSSWSQSAPDSLNASPSHEQAPALSYGSSEAYTGLSNALTSGSSASASSAPTNSGSDSGLSGTPTTALPAPNYSAASCNSLGSLSANSSDSGGSSIGSAASSSSSIGGSTSSAGSSPSGSISDGGSTASSSASTSASASSNSGSSGTSSGT